MISYYLTLLELIVTGNQIKKQNKTQMQSSLDNRWARLEQGSHLK